MGSKMKKITTKVLNIILIFCMVVLSGFLNISSVYAKTVRDLQNELDKLQQESNNTDAKIRYTEDQIKKAKSDVTKIDKDIDNMAQEIINKQKEIEDLNVQIQSKDKETKELMEFLQLSNGDSFYLDYIMGSESLTDFIYRVSIVEQLSKYNSDLIIKMNNMIEENKNRQIELNNETKALEKKQDTLASNITILSSQKIKLDEYDRSLSDEIAVARDTLKMYRDAGCGENEDLTVCANKILPPDSGFIRPLSSGYVTSEFSYARRNPVSGAIEAHAAIDVSSENKSSLVYSIANGKVANVFYDKYGGNEVVVHHKIISGGSYVYYSSTYVHLAEVYVKIGQAISKSTAVGKMGSTGLYSTGPHLHLAVSTGLRYKDYVSYDSFVAHSINPRLVISFPGYRVKWNSR
jgi:peptidoglycan hydrolase CwlO-like protein